MPRRLVAYAVAFLVFGLDRAAKALVAAHMTAADVYTVIPGFFHIVYAENRGMAFSLLAEGGGEWKAFFLIGLTALIMAFVATVLWQTPHTGVAAGWRARLGLSFVLGGGMGNLYDRIRGGAVVDFLDFQLGGYHWPAFNVADSMITVGVALVLLDVWLDRRKARAD